MIYPDLGEKLIKAVTLSQGSAAIGESIHVCVITTNQAVEVTVNGITGREHFLQFGSEGAKFIVVSAKLGKHTEQTDRRVSIRSLKPNDIPMPLILATCDRYHPRTIAFSIGNSSSEPRDTRTFKWNFGDDAESTGRGASITHDYSDGLDRDALTTTFHVRVEASNEKGEVVSATRTIAVFNLYGYNKLRNRILSPRVRTDKTPLVPMVALRGDVICSFTIENLEDEELSFTSEKHEWLTTELLPGPSKNAIGRQSSGNAVNPYTSTASAYSYKVAPGIGPQYPVLDIRVPARSTVSVSRSFKKIQFKDAVFGVAIHLSGAGMCSKLPAFASAYVEVNLPWKWGGYVDDARLVETLSLFTSGKLTATITHADLQNFIRQDIASGGASANSAAARTAGAEISAAERMTTERQTAQGGRAPQQLDMHVVTGASAVDISGLFDPAPGLFDPDDVIPGNECDPDNVPDKLPEGAACQLSGEYRWRYVPGRILNAKKGDILLSPGGQGLIGELLQQVMPSQTYSHSGIMTQNHTQVRHSTASPEWLAHHLNGNGADGFEPAALKYLWPGTITQSIDQAYYGEWKASPEGPDYQIGTFAFEVDRGNHNALVYPVVVKPQPFLETKQIRLTLHSIANQALSIEGHYRFYCYTRPEIALGPAGVAGSDSGWAKNTVATVCSSFIWLAAQHANVRLEGPGPITTVDDLEPKDTVGGGATAADTLDGLYLYTAEERLRAAKWLYQKVFDEVNDVTTFWGSRFYGAVSVISDAPDNVANQICNTFASDWADTPSKDSSDWKGTDSANAVSPDNILLWDSPGSDNQRQFRSVYGYAEELKYLPGTYARVPVYRWKIVKTRGSITGTVLAANAGVAGANVSLIGSGIQDVVVGENGRFRFDDVPVGNYTLTAGLNIDNYWNSAEATPSVVAGQTVDVPMVLQHPLGLNRIVTVSVEGETNWSSAYAHSPNYLGPTTKFVMVSPFSTHGHLDFDSAGAPRAHVEFEIDLHADLSVSIAWKAMEIDDEIEGVTTGGYTLPQDTWFSLDNLSVSNGDPIDNDRTILNFYVTNNEATT